MLAETAPVCSDDRSNRATITAHSEMNWNNFFAVQIQPDLFRGSLKILGIHRYSSLADFLF